MTEWRSKPIDDLRCDHSRAPVRFEAFYRAHRARICRALAGALGDAHLAEEAVDEAMTRAYERWSEVRGYQDLSAWVYRVAINWARSLLRKLGRVDLGEAPEKEVWDRPNLDPQLEGALGRLPVPIRSVIVLRYFMQLSQQEISHTLDMPVGTVKSRIGRGLNALRADAELMR
jgi:RNA polymerase sigma factor (sigma-70 family)